MSKLDSNSKHLLMLIMKCRKLDGWATVSDVVWPLMETLPCELVEMRNDANGKFVRLTDTGETVLAWT